MMRQGDPGRYTMNHKAFWKALQETDRFWCRFLKRFRACRKEYDLDHAWEKLMTSVEGEEVVRKPCLGPGFGGVGLLEGQEQPELRQLRPRCLGARWQQCLEHALGRSLGVEMQGDQWEIALFMVILKANVLQKGRLLSS